MSQKRILRVVKKPQITFIEVCAGAGGLSCGLIKAGFVPLLLNDNNYDCCQTLRLNHKNVNIVHGSMADIDCTQWVGQVDLLTGGVPCQSFSQAGLRKGLSDPRGELIYTFAKMVEQIKPKVFMIENVKGITTHDSGNTFKQILNILNPINAYTLTYEVLNAIGYGVPQKRERVFIVGTLNTDIHTHNKFCFPPPQHNIISIRDALTNVPISPCAQYPLNKINLFKKIPQGGCWINLSNIEQRAYLGKSYNSGGGKRGILYRLSMDKPSLTLLCSPSQKQTERCHPLEERPLSVREYARIQTFEDTYEFYGSMTSQYKQIGNAVPVKLAHNIGMYLLEEIKLHYR